MAQYNLTRIQDGNENNWVFGVESISNVNGLQAALDAKATPANITDAINTEVNNRNNAIASSANTKVSKSGDTMTGELDITSSNSCQLMLRRNSNSNETDLNVHKPGTSGNTPYVQTYYTYSGYRGIYDSKTGNSVFEIDDDDKLHYLTGQVDGNLTIEKSSWPYLVIHNTNSGNVWSSNIKLQQDNSGHARLVENEPAHSGQSSIDHVIMAYYDTPSYTGEVNYKFCGISNRSFADSNGNNIVTTYATKEEAIGVHGASLVTSCTTEPIFDCQSLNSKKSGDPDTHGEYTGPHTVSMGIITIPEGLRATDSSHPRTVICRISARYQPDWSGYNVTIPSFACDTVFQNVITASGAGDLASCIWERHGSIGKTYDAGSAAQGNPYYTFLGTYENSYSAKHIWEDTWSKNDHCIVGGAVNVVSSHFDSTLFLSIPYGAVNLQWNLTPLCMAGSHMYFGRFLNPTCQFLWL